MNTRTVGKPSQREKLKPRRQIKGRMEEVYAKAAMLFKENGFINTSVSQIAGELKIQKASLYYYIKDKETLLYEILSRTMDQMLDQVESVAILPLSPEKKLDRVIHSHIENAVKYLNEFSVLLHDTRRLSPELRKNILSKRKQYEKVFLNIITDGIEQKVFKREDEKMLLYMILGSCNWLYQWFYQEGNKDPRQIANVFSRIFLEGLLKK
jgi:TetR/AcrR family transcriptional regulator, cholesterol catabolism regulator